MSDFDAYDASAYRAAVRRATRFSGQDHDFFLRAKADHLVDAVRRQGRDPATASLLDVGSGVGLMEPFLVEPFGAISGCDVSRVAVDEARAANPAVDYRFVAGRTLPFDDAAFDVTIAGAVLHHVPGEARPEFVAELARVTRPGGVIAVFEHNPLNPFTRLVVARCPFDEGVALLRPKEVASLARAAGMVPRELRYLLFFPADRPIIRALERRLLRRVPLGAQYCALALRP